MEGGQPSMMATVRDRMTVRAVFARADSAHRLLQANDVAKWRNHTLTVGVPIGTIPMRYLALE